MSSINPETVVSVLKDQIENYDQKTEVKEEGRIIQIADGIATVYGMDQAMYGELVIFETGVHGLVLNVERNCIGCVLLGSDHGLMEGSKVARTGVQADIPVGDAMIGRVVNAIGEPIDGKGEIKTDERRPIEHEAAGVIDRKSVDQPLQTGILAIDSMFPIGRGQRELIIGDRQTGKTSIAVDTILNLSTHLVYPHIIIFAYCSYEELVKRKSTRDDNDQWDLADAEAYNSKLERYREQLNSRNAKVIELNTSCSIEEVYKMIDEQVLPLI